MRGLFSTKGFKIVAVDMPVNITEVCLLLACLPSADIPWCMIDFQWVLAAKYYRSQKNRQMYCKEGEFCRVVSQLVKPRARTCTDSREQICEPHSPYVPALSTLVIEISAVSMTLLYYCGSWKKNTKT